MEEKKALPDGIEWPRFEDDTPVRFGDMGLDVHGRRRPVMSVKFTQAGLTFIGDDMGGMWWDNGTGPMEDLEVDHGKRVKRPAPKVLDADGVEVRVGDTVWPKYPSADRNAQVERVEVVGIQAKYGRVDVRTLYATGLSFLEQVDADRLTHRAPVLAADGKPLEVGQTVWWICEGDERGIHAEKLHVESIGEDGFVTCAPFNGGTWVELEPSELYVNKPVLDADGVPIKVGDTVWDTRGNGPYIIKKIENGRFIRIEGSDLNYFGYEFVRERPDTWERIEEDAGCTATKYNERRGTTFTTKQQVARDLVRRCRALAERERGE